jgi:tetratricopeptide (TPR) repeat protein
MAGELLRLAGHTPEAVECFRASLTQARRTGDTQDVYQALSQCAETEETLGHLEKAHAYLNEQHGLLNRLPPDTAHELAFNERTLDEDDLRDRDELLTMEEMLDTPEELIPILNRLSQLYMEDKDYEAAWTTLNREYELSMRIGRVVGALETKLNMAICASDAHEFKRAYALFDELLTWAKNLAIPGFQANIEVNYGLSRLVSDGPKEALPYFQKSLDVFEAIQDVQGIAFASWQVAYVLRMQKRDEEARHYQARADRLMRQAGLTPIVPVFQPDGEDRR